MPIRFLDNNLADSAVLTESTQVTGFPVENVQDTRLTTRWKTGVAGISTIDDCEATTGWIATNAPNETLDGVDFTEGSNSLNLGKSGGGILGDYQTQPPMAAFDLTDAHGGLDFYVKDKTEFTNIKIIFASGGGTAFYFKDFAPGVLTDLDSDGDPWNDLLELAADAVQDWNTSGVPDITAINVIRINITTSGAADTIALGNLKMDFWRSSPLAEFIEFDFTTAQAVTAAVIDGHNFDGTETNILLDSSTDASSWTNRATFTFISGEPMVVFIDSVSARYWRIHFTKAILTEEKQIGRVFIGTYVQPTRGMQLGWRRTLTDLSAVKRAHGGTIYGDIRNKFWEVDFKLKHEPVATFSTLRTAISTFGVGTHLWMAFEPTANPNGPLTLYGLFTKPWSESEPLNDVFDASFKFAEDL